MDPKVIRKEKGIFILEGEEITEVHVNTEKLTFSIGTLLPGQSSTVDKGHKDTEEICYVSTGKIIICLPGLKKCYLLNEGDSILIPPNESHYSKNASEKTAITVWAVPMKVEIE